MSTKPTRDQVLAHIRVAGYHNDPATALRLYVENRVSYTAYLQAYAAGQLARLDGVPCSCAACSTVEQKATAE